MCNNCAEVSHNISIWDLCKNISASDRANDTIVDCPYIWEFHSTTFIAQCFPKPVTPTPSSDSLQYTTESTTIITNYVNPLLQQISGDSATAETKNVISISDGIILEAATQQRVKNKILANQLIDLNITLQQR